MPSKVTQQDIAERAHVDRSSVSLALRGSPRISLAKSQQIKLIVKETGYRPNPLVSALMQTRRKPSNKSSTAIAYVTGLTHNHSNTPKSQDTCDLLPSIVKRASELGYELEHFQLYERNQTPEKLCITLTSRNIRGLLIGNLLPDQHSINLPWQNFASVALGMTLRAPSLNRVGEDCYSGALEAMTQLYKRGYKRVGYIFSRAHDTPPICDRRLAAFLVKQLFVPAKNRLNPFEFGPGMLSKNHFLAWLQEQKPDALLASRIDPIREHLHLLGEQSNSPIGIATLANDHPNLKIAGIRCNVEKLGSLAVETLVDSIQRNEFGIPADPHEILLCGVWHEGESCRATK